MPSQERPFIFKRVDGIATERKLPALLSSDRAALTTFIERVWELPSEWHRFPGSSLVLRTLPSGDTPRTPRFEIRNAGDPVGVYEFRCDLVRRIIDGPASGELAHLHYDLIPSEDCPFLKEIDQFALAIVATIVQRPDTVRSPHATSPGGESQSVHPPVPEPGSMGRVFSEMMRRIMDHWTGPSARNWSFRRRFIIAGGGSFTFWAIRPIIAEPDILRYAFRIMDDLLAVFWLSFVVLIVSILTSVYGYFISWDDRQHGPVRLYLGGFLLSYFVWFLLSRA